ncbi:hypothetical protein J6590_068647 [Homalodisca vitripennis]|nr:hypothetical protein J6590_068647 [Homalodisca vitripennis]
MQDPSKECFQASDLIFLSSSSVSFPSREKISGRLAAGRIMCAPAPRRAQGGTAARPGPGAPPAGTSVF